MISTVLTRQRLIRKKIISLIKLRFNKYLARLAFIISLTFAFQMLGLPQALTGPVVNMMLIFTTLLLGPSAGAIIGTASPLVAIVRGQLPPLFLPLIVFIALGNILYVIIFYLIAHNKKAAKFTLQNCRNWIALVFAALLKFFWLAVSVKTIIPFALGRRLPDVLITMMTVPQLITALVGGALALLLFDLLQHKVPDQISPF